VENSLDDEFQEFNEFKELVRERKKYEEEMKKCDEEWKTARMMDEVEQEVEVEVEVEDAATMRLFEGFAKGVEGFVLERRALDEELGVQVRGSHVRQTSDTARFKGAFCGPVENNTINGGADAVLCAYGV